MDILKTSDPPYADALWEKLRELNTQINTVHNNDTEWKQIEICSLFTMLCLDSGVTEMGTA